MTDLRAVTARELDNQLAMALRTRNQTHGGRCVREYRRRGIEIPPRLYRWALGVFPEQVKTR